MDYQAQSEAVWINRIQGGAPAIKLQSAKTKLLWTFFGMALFGMLFLAFQNGTDAINWPDAFSAQSYRDRGGLFLIAPWWAAVLLWISLTAPQFMCRKEIAKARSSATEPIRLQPFFLSVVISLATAETISLIGILLVTQSKQFAFMIPYSVASLIAWLRAYPTREKIERLFFNPDFSRG
jgi:hypothetical protein